MATDSSSASPLGCIPFVIGILTVWALLFGVTVGGKHHDVSCSCSRGVDITTREAK